MKDFMGRKVNWLFGRYQPHMLNRWERTWPWTFPIALLVFLVWMVGLMVMESRVQTFLNDYDAPAEEYCRSIGYDQGGAYDQRHSTFSFDRWDYPEPDEIGVVCWWDEGHWPRFDYEDVIK